MVILDSPIVSFDCIEKMILLQNCMCRIIIGNGDSKAFGSGFFAYIRNQDQEYPVLITCDFILKKENLNEINLNVGKDNKQIKIKVKDNRFIYSKKMRFCGITIIEIFPKDDKINNFYEFDDFTNVEGKEIYIPQYPNSDKLSVSYGKIKKLNDIDNTIIHLCSTDYGAGGGPIINIYTNKVIAIHAGGTSNFDSDIKARRYKAINFGYLLKNIITDYIIKKKNYKESDFKNIKLLSSGLFGNIYSAYSIKDKKEVCLKKINLEKMKLNYQMNELNDYKNDINNEIEILQTLNFTDNSVEYYGNYDNENEKVIVMEKCDKNFKEYIKETGKALTIKEIQKEFLGLNKLFRFMYLKKNIIHRDLKLENFLIKYIDKGNYTIKLADYGISKFEKNSNSIFSGLKGTPETVAPEIILEKIKKYESSVDMFSLGIILYQLSHNLKHPFGTSYEKCVIIYNNYYEKDDFIVEFDKEIIDQDFKDLISKMIKINPKNRLNWEDYFEHNFFKKTFN